MKKFDKRLSKKVLCSLLAAGVLGTCVSAQAASLNGKTNVFGEDGHTVTRESIVGKNDDSSTGAGSSKFVIGQGNISVQTTGSAALLLRDLMSTYSTISVNLKLEQLRDALQQDRYKNLNYVVITGLVGGEGQIDAGTQQVAQLAAYVAKGDNNINGKYGDLSNLLYKFINIDTVTQNKDLSIGSNNGFDTSNNDFLVPKTEENSNITIIIGEDDENNKSEPVILGIIGGDLSISALSSLELEGNGNKGELLEGYLPDIDIERSSNININIESGNVLGGVGGSAAVALGNIQGEDTFSITVEGDKQDVYILADTNGKAITTINGNIATNVNAGANLAVFANGGLAAGIGGEAISTVNGNTALNVTSIVDSDELEGITIGLAGGGTAITTLGGKATSTVDGKTLITINNGLSAGVIGGGLAAAIDASEIGNLVKKGDDDYSSGLLGNEINYKDNGNISTDFKLLGINVILNNVNEGGEAKSIVTGGTTITLKGSTTAAGVIGGGLAAATHGYVGNKDDQSDIYNKSVGNSSAEVKTGKSIINVNLEVPEDFAQNGKSKLVSTVKDVPEKLSGLLLGMMYPHQNNQVDLIGTVSNIISGTADNGAVLGIIGGGGAIALDSAINSSFQTDRDKRYPSADGYFGAKAKAEFAGAEINLASGYVVGTFGGGAAAATNFANASSTTTDDIVINASGAEAVGVWGNGIAYFTGTEFNSAQERNNLEGKAEVTAQDTTINITGGTVDGVYGGGIAIDDSNADTVNAIVKTEGTSTINVTGEVNKLNYAVLGVEKPDEKDDYMNAIGTAAQDFAIVGGGVAAGGGALSEVKESVINVNSGAQVNGDILAGGIAVVDDYTIDNKAGSYVKKSTINLNSGAIVDGSVYAGGAVDEGVVDKYYEARAQVEESVINLNGADVSGQFIGTGVGDAARSTVGSSTLNVMGANTLGLAKDKAGNVIGSKIVGFDNVVFTADSVTTLDGGLVAGVEGATPVIDGAGKSIITVQNGARLNVNNLEPTKGFTPYLIADNYDAQSSLWSNSALAYDRLEKFAYAQNSGEQYTILFKNLSDLTDDEQLMAIDAFAGSFGKYSEQMENYAKGAILDGTKIASEAPGARAFFKDATMAASLAEVERGAATVMMLGEESGVTSNAIAIAKDIADTSVLRLSFTQDYVTGDRKVDTDGNIWAKYVHNKHDVDGMSSSFNSLYSSSDYDGVIIGTDFAQVGKAQSGVAFTYGSGDSHGAGVNNDFDMWGVTLFGNIKNDDSNVIADIGFSKSSNELSGSVFGKRLTSDRDLKIFTVGARAEKLYTNGNTQIVPYGGLRYMSVDPSSYTSYYDGKKAFSYDADRQNVWLLPVGVSLRHEAVSSGWKLTPQFDLSYIWAFGDTDNNVDVSMAGYGSSFNYTVMDSGSWLGTVAFEASKENWTCGLGYSYQKGSHAESNKWFVNVEYSF